MFSGFIFDVEGTLIANPKEPSGSAWALRPSGTVRHLQLYSGLDGDQTVQLVAAHADESERKEILKAQGTIYEERYLYRVVPFDGVRHVFKSLVEQRGRIALATDCKGPELKNYLSLLGVNEFMSATACGDDVEHGKPDPRLVGMALRKLDLPGSQTVMIGDTPYDAEAATEAGTAVAGVLTGEFASGFS
jgi:phosphoglycolate phosphatase-like HAD superfamily hydrolase